MLILTIRTDNPVAEIGLYQDGRQVDYVKWDADRKLAETIHQQIQNLLVKNNQSLDKLEGLGVYEGPGSFTGLRIGLSVANALAASLKIPIVSSTGDDWTEQSEQKLSDGQNETVALPEYGALPNITSPRK